MTPGIFFLLALLYVGQPLLIPLSFAMLISLILFPVTRFLEHRGWPKVLAIFTGMSLIMLLLAGLVILLVQQFSQFLTRWPQMQEKLDKAINQATHNAGIILGFSDLQKQEWINSLIQNVSL